MEQKTQLTESQLYSIIRESVRKTLNEISTELAGAAAIKASHLVKNGDLSDEEKEKKERQAQSLYRGARDRFDDEHKHPGFYTTAEMPSVYGQSKKSDYLSMGYESPQGGSNYKTISFDGDGDKYSRVDGQYNGVQDFDKRKFYKNANNQTLRRLDRTTKDYTDLRNKSDKYRQSLENDGE